MALEIINAPGRPGYAHLIFTQDIGADPLRIAVYNFIKREYLGPSAGKPNWTPARSHFFPATLVERTQGRATYLIGPEVTTFIPDEATIEVTSQDNAIREVAVWSGILLDFQWRGPDAELEANKALELEQARRREEEARRLQQEQARLQREAEERAKRQSAVTTSPEPPLETGSEGTAATSSSRSWPWILAAIGVLALAVVMGALNRPYLCDHFGLFCDAEARAYQAAESCAKPISCGANTCIADYRRAYPEGRYKAQIDRISTTKGAACPDPAELAAYERATSCAAPKSCGANECFADYRRLFPEGAHKAEIEKLSAQKGDVCPVPPAPVDIELQLFEKAKACAAPKSCGANECLAEYRRAYPNGRFKAQIEQISMEKGIDCGELERRVYDKARQCAAPKMCGANECLAEYRRLYPNGQFKSQIDQISSQKGIDCGELERDRAAYEKADRCARSLSCGALACVTDYRRDFPNGRFREQIDQIAGAPKAQECINSLEREAYERAETCARPLSCGALSCVTEYRRDYPNGRFKLQIDQILELKGIPCTPTPPSPTPTPTPPPPPPTPTPTPPPQPPLPPFRPIAGEYPGFTCATLRNPEPIEEMICADGDFARENGELQRAFDSRMARLGPAEKTRLRQEERDWITRRDSECNIPHRGTPWDEMALRKVKTCFLEKTRTRRNELQQ